MDIVKGEMQIVPADTEVCKVPLSETDPTAGEVITVLGRTTLVEITKDSLQLLAVIVDIVAAVELVLESSVTKVGEIQTVHRTFVKLLVP